MVYMEASIWYTNGRVWETWRVGADTVYLSRLATFQRIISRGGGNKLGGVGGGEFLIQGAKREQIVGLPLRIGFLPL